MHKYKVATCKYVYSQNEAEHLEYFERGGLEKQRRGPPHSSYSRINTDNGWLKLPLGCRGQTLPHQSRVH